MGVYLPKPKMDKESEDGGDSDVSGTRFGLTAMQGWRQYMEDAHLAETQFKFDGLPESGLFGVFDGHGGPAVSAWVAKVFDSTLREELASVKEGLKTNEIKRQTEGFDDSIVMVCEALQRTFLKLDEAMKTESSRQELKLLHEEAERKKKQDQEDESEDGSERHPESLLEAIFSGIGGRKPFVRMIEQDGQKFFQLISRDVSDEDDDDEEESEDRHESSGVPRFEDLGEATDEVEGNSGSVTVAAAAVQEDSKDVKEDKEFYDEDTEDVSLTVGFDRAASRRGEEVEKALGSLNEQKKTDKHEASSKQQSQEEESEDEKMEGVATKNEESDMISGGLGSDGKQILPYQPECCGSTAIVMMVIGGDSPNLITANAGDSRAVLCRNGIAIPLSKDHKPGLKGETERISKAGGKVVNGRVDGNLNLSRSIGDLFYKRDTNLTPEEQKITAYPDVRVTPLTPDDEFVIVACDGIWDCLTNQKAVDVVREKLAAVATTANGGKASASQLSKICEEICDAYISKNPLESEGGIGCDNMTMMIVQLKPSLLRNAKPVMSDSPTIFYGEEPDLSELPSPGDLPPL